MSPTIYLLIYLAIPIKNKMQRLTRQNKKNRIRFILHFYINNFMINKIPLSKIQQAQKIKHNKTKKAKNQMKSKHRK
jgi:hypothetical protein